jgi:uncharacterized protein YkvS
MSIVSNVTIFGNVKDCNHFPVVSGKSNMNLHIKSETEDLFEFIYKKVYASMQDILNNFASGDIRDELYTKTNLLSISTKLYRMKKTNIKCYNGIIELLQDNLSCLYRGYLYYLENKDMIEGMKLCKEKVDILEDMDKLKEYLDKLNRNMVLFEITSTINVNANIKQEYVIYIQRYGFPKDGVFDLEKLSGIIIEIT